MMGIGSSPGAPKSSIMFLMSMERSATLRSAARSAQPMRVESRIHLPVSISTLSEEISLTFWLSVFSAMLTVMGGLVEGIGGDYGSEID